MGIDKENTLSCWAKRFINPKQKSDKKQTIKIGAEKTITSAMNSANFVSTKERIWEDKRLGMGEKTGQML